MLAGLLSIYPLPAQNIAANYSGSAVLEIYLIGSVHTMHFEEGCYYSLVDLQAQVRPLRPDAVCGEITPDVLDSPMEGNFPPEAAMPAEMAAAWEPASSPLTGELNLHDRRAHKSRKTTTDHRQGE